MAEAPPSPVIEVVVVWSCCITSPEKLKEAVEVHQKAPDDLVSLNSLFTAAVFVGLAFASPKTKNIQGNKVCEAGVPMARRLVMNEVISFACYLFSSLVAKALKTHLFTYLRDPPPNLDTIKSRPRKALRGFLFTLSVLTSIIGSVFLLYSMVDMVQLRLGKLTCKGSETMHAFGTLITVNTLALAIYVPFIGHAIYNSTKIFNNLQKTTKDPKPLAVQTRDH